MSVQFPVLARNSAWMLLARFGTQGLTVLFTILVARQLGGAGFGEYAFISSVIFTANAVTTFGTDMLLIRQVAGGNDLSGVVPALILQLLFSAVFVVVVWTLSPLIPNQRGEVVLSLKIYTLALIPLAFYSVCSSLLRGMERMDLYAVLSLLFAVLQVGYVLLLFEGSLVTLAAILLAIQGVTAVAGVILCVRANPALRDAFRFPRDRFVRSLADFLKAAAPIAVLGLLGIFAQRVSIQLLSLLSGPAETGTYAAAFRTVEASKTAHLAVFAALYPAFARSASGLGLGRIASPAPKPFTLLIAGAGVISITLFFVSRPLVLLLFGRDFAASADVLQILAWVLVPFTVNTYLTLSFLAASREWDLGRALTGSLLCLLILAFWWIPAWGARGAAWAVLAAECLQSSLLLAGVGSLALVKGEAHELSNIS